MIDLVLLAAGFNEKSQHVTTSSLGWCYSSTTDRTGQCTVKSLVLKEKANRDVGGVLKNLYTPEN